MPSKVWDEITYRFLNFSFATAGVNFKTFTTSDQLPCYLSSQSAFYDRVFFYQYEIILTPEWISNHIPSKVWDGITYRFLNFSVTTADAWDWIGNLSHTLLGMTWFIYDGIQVRKRGPGKMGSVL